jgi:hypothetical protein
MVLEYAYSGTRTYLPWYRRLLLLPAGAAQVAENLAAPAEGEYCNSSNTVLSGDSMVLEYHIGTRLVERKSSRRAGCLHLYSTILVAIPWYSSRYL